MTDHVHLDAKTIDMIIGLAKVHETIQKIGGTSQMIVPVGYKVHDLTAAIEKAQPIANRKTGVAHLADIESFIQYLKDQDCAASGYIYADPEAMTLTAVFNDFQSIDAGWRDHRAVYKAELSREFATWKSNNRQAMEQEMFAIFLEDNIADVVEPSGDELLRVAPTLQAKTTVDFSSARRLDNGEVQLTYTENIDARAANGSIEIPREFAIGARLFKNGDGYKLKARLKYRLGAGKVKFWYELDRPENALEDAFKAYVAKAAESGYTILIGKA